MRRALHRLGRLCFGLVSVIGFLVSAEAGMTVMAQLMAWGVVPVRLHVLGLGSGVGMLAWAELHRFCERRIWDRRGHGE